MIDPWGRAVGYEPVGAGNVRDSASWVGGLSLGGAAATYAYSAMFMVLLESGWWLRPSSEHPSGQYPSNDGQYSGLGGGWATQE